ncbi:MAG: PilZ domain-containing protein [Neisseria sp.]|nr:PilZ domain-containing protein [Neisseria sp.]
MAQAPDKKNVKMITLNIRDRTMLYSSYMSYLKSGGLFVVTSDEFTMGEEVLLVLEIMEHDAKFPLRTHVVWQNPKGNNPMRPGGIGLAFSGDDVSKQARTVIETNLAGLLDNPRPTYTM